MKKTLSIVLALMMVLSTVSLAAPTMVSTVTDANEISVDATEIEKTTLASTTSEAATFKPGVNILTGTEEALNFNNMQDVTVTDGILKDAEDNLVLTYDNSAAAKLSVVDSPVSSQDGKVIKLGDYPLNTKNPYPKVKFDNYDMPDDGRPVLITYKALVLNADNCSNVGELNNKGGINFNWIIYGDGTNSNAGLNSYRSTATTYEWKWSVHAYDKTKTSKTKYSKPGYIQGSVAVANGTGFTKDDLQPNHYYDDISFVPYYKVTYMNGDTKLGEAWVLDDGNGNILDSFNPVDYFEGEYPAGTNAWSLKKDGKPTHNITLNNEDIVVYAVHERNFTPGINILTKTSEALNFDSSAYAVSGSVIYVGGVKKFSVSSGSASIVASPVVGETENKALKFKVNSIAANGSLYPQLVNFVGTLPEDGRRPVFVGAKLLVGNADNLSTAVDARSMRVGADDYTTNYASGVYEPITTFTPENAPADWFHYGIMDKVSTTKLPRFVMTFKASAAGTASPELYVDDILMVPYYKVTYMNGDQQIGEPVWVLDDGNGNILDSFNPVDYFKGEYPAGTNAWSLTKGGKPTHNITLNNEDIVVYAVHERNFTPGINILTKTSEALNFDSSAYAVSGSNINVGGVKKFSVTDSSASIVASPVVGETENKVLKLKVNSIAANGSLYPQLVNFVGTLPDEAGRPVFVGAKLLVGNADNLSTRSMRVGADDYFTNYASGVYTPIDIFTSESAPDDWFHYGIMDKVSTTKLPRFVMTFKASAAGTASPELYVDDILMVPYYKVTYMNGDQQIGEPVWVLDDGKGNILDSFNPAEQGVELPEGKNIWSLKDGGEAVTQVALEYKDIVLYAGYDEEIQDELCPESYFTSSIRTADPSGIRFCASVTTEQKTQAEEYGFIVTLEKHLGTTEAESLTMESNITKLTGVSYGIDPTTGSSVDKIFEKTNENIFFTAALYGMPDTEDAYRQKIIVRPYLKDKDGNYHYAQPIIRSVLDVAIAIRDGGYTVVDEDGKKYVENILTVCNESQN